jgi:hypothetical protein
MTDPREPSSEEIMQLKQHLNRFFDRLDERHTWRLLEQQLVSEFKFEGLPTGREAQRGSA